MKTINWIGVNLNETVRVRLTAHGGAILRENHDKLWRDTPRAAPVFTLPDEDKHGCSEWQLWDLMHQFGKHLWNGCRIPFADNEMQFQFEKESEWNPPNTAPKDGTVILMAAVLLSGQQSAFTSYWKDGEWRTPSNTIIDEMIPGCVITGWRDISFPVTK